MNVTAAVKKMGNKDAARDLTISEIVGDTNFYVGDIPSIMSYYDTETIFFLLTY